MSCVVLAQSHPTNFTIWVLLGVRGGLRGVEALLPVPHCSALMGHVPQADHQGLGIPGVAVLKLAIDVARQRGHPLAPPREPRLDLRAATQIVPQ
jgi:hypothetical protein